MRVKDISVRLFKMRIGPFDLRFVEIFHELYALEQFMDSIESQLPDLIKKEKEKAYENLHRKKCENDQIEWDQMQRELYELIEEVLPRYFRNPIIVTLWAIFESAIIEVAKEVRDQQGLPVRLDDINGDFLERTNKYFNHIIKLPIDTQGKSWQRLRKFYVLRNAIAHANGRIGNIKKAKDHEKIKQWGKENIGVSTMGGNLICSSTFIRDTYAVVLEVLEAITKRVQAEYPKPKNW